MTSASASAMSTAEVNESVWIILGSVMGLAAVGVAADMAIRRSGRKRADLPRMWALALLFGSYGCLAPGLVLNLLSADTSVNALGQTLQLASISESMLALIHRMLTQHMYTGAVLVILYALVIPVVKVLLLVLGVCFQMGRNPQMHRARQCIVAVRSVSKWASPDMFAYILITNLFRSIDHPPKLNSTGDLGVGFTCFCVFCAMSTVASLGLPVPEVPADSEGEKTAEDVVAASSARCGQRPVARVVLSLLLATAFGVLLGYGLVMPCMTLHMDMDVLYSSRPALKPFAFVIDTLGLPALLRSEVSISSCLMGLADWIAEGNANGAVAFAMYAVFAVLVPALDVAALLVCAFIPGASGAASRASSVLGKISMLDVALMGVVVTVLSLRNLRDNGAVVALGPGLAPLVAAEVCHYALALVVPKPTAFAAKVARCGTDASTMTPSEAAPSECTEAAEDALP